MNKLGKKLRRYKTVKLSGVKFTIRKINPLLDFAPDKMPQIFSDFKSQRKPDPDAKISPEQLRRSLQDMGEMIKAGVVEPKVGEDVQLDDILADQRLTYDLYTEILIHSMNIFKGIKGVFFYLRTKHYLYTLWRRSLAHYR
ncbi:MAG: hypothetical protein U9Q38_02600 [Thermodesulfobacteriota bacterium]|nr:hypothetical protein [Thermodesulfobacteriota bacterium]